MRCPICNSEIVEPIKGYWAKPIPKMDKSNVNTRTLPSTMVECFKAFRGPVAARDASVYSCTITNGINH